MVNEVLSHLLSDLAKVQHVCNEEHLEEVPEVCIDYLEANKDALQFFVQQVFSKTDATQRRALLSQHSELDGSVVSDGFQSIASDALFNAEKQKRSEVHRHFFSVKEDNLHMLLRALEFAKYCPLEPRHFDLRLSPIEEHGLNRRFGNFESTSPEEWRVISWHVADILYGAEKAKALTNCKKLGLDVEKKEAVPGDRYPDWKNKWTAVLFDLLKYRAECDLAVVLLTAPQKRKKYLNAVDNRLDTEYSSLLFNVRETLQRLIADFSDCAERSMEIDVEDDLKPLKTSYAELRSNLLYMQPRPALFEDASRLSGGGKEWFMGDKYEFHGQAAGVGRNVNIQNVNFNQIWDQSRSSLNLGKLADDLARLREAMAKESTSAEQFVAVGNVASAEVEARNEHGPTALEYLSKAGKWALDVATKIGVPVAIEALKKTVGV